MWECQQLCGGTDSAIYSNTNGMCSHPECEPMNNITVLYHRNCADGFCAAYLFHMKYPDAEFISCQYGDSVPKIAGSELFIVDFSFDRDTLIDLSKKYKLTVLDHHKTAEENCKGLDFCTFDMNKCGARLALEWLEHNVLNIPKHIRDLVDYVEDRDLWKWELSKSREVSAAIRSYPFDFDAWESFRIKSLAQEGKSILRYQRQQVKSHVKHARDITFGGYTIPSVACTCSDLISDIGQELAKDQPFGVVYFDIDTHRVYSLRSREDSSTCIDVGALAKMFGGGGHVHAAGFKLPIGDCI